MSRRNKLQKFSDILSYPNVYENYDPKEAILLGEAGAEVSLKGKWTEIHFKNNNPLVLELACGRGEYTLALAQKYPNKNFIGVDIKGARIWKGASQALALNLQNAAFLRTRIEILNAFIGENEVDEIWITFPDPFLRKSKANRRLTSHFFLNKYKPILKQDHLIHLKTDSPELYEFSMESLASYEGAQILYHSKNIYSDDLENPDLAFKTYYEKMHLQDNRLIKYIRFKI